ncbi:capsid protein [Salinicola sp. JS01]|uniref:major coat protein n=1 Tax=Salinicola sp. JS01 TaxID=3050071 RepID=UPI00255B97E6|nr:major coat protein [Salinicola sp. JS01]WIX31600.1 capsid protein [Salinicola sp. JS01]
MKTRLKNALVTTRNAARSIPGKVAMIGVGTIATASAAMASDAGGSAASAAFKSLQDQGSSMASEAWPVVTAIVGSLLAIGLFKKFANKAT